MNAIDQLVDDLGLDESMVLNRINQARETHYVSLDDIALEYEDNACVDLLIFTSRAVYTISRIGLAVGLLIRRTDQTWIHHRMISPGFHCSPTFRGTEVVLGHTNTTVGCEAPELHRVCYQFMKLVRMMTRRPRK